MDEPIIRFGPSRPLALLSAAAAVVAVGAAVAADAGGRLLLGVAAVALAAYALDDLIRTPRLVADPVGITCGRRRFEWTSVTVRVDRRSRLGRISQTLEVDDGEHLVVLARHALGVDPAVAYDAIRRLAPSDHRGAPGDYGHHHRE